MSLFHPQSPQAQAISTLFTSFLWLAAVIFLVVAGLVMRVVERGGKRVSHKNRCTICKTPVPEGAIYCREHLRRMLQREDERTHMTQTRR